MPSLEDLQNNLEFTTGGKTKTGGVTFLPEPERARRDYLIVSVDDHIVEPPNAFEGRMPKKFADAEPRIVTRDDGSETWVYDGLQLPNVGFNAVVGRPVSEYSMEPARFDEMRRGAWDIHARVKDMDLAGVWASMNFPSFLPGFAGQRLQLGHDPELALAAVRAWNDWCIEEWAGPYPDRIIPMQIPYFLDPEIGAEEVRRNAERGFKAITFSEAPDKLGLPTLHSGYWDPIMRACEETGTVVSLHIGSSGQSPGTTEDAPPDVVGVLFFGYAMFAAVDWLYSLIPVRFPNIRFCMSEGGIGWVAGLLDRLDHVGSYQAMYGTWKGIDLSPREVMTRNFYFCAIDDPAGFDQRHHIGVDRILIESDYPHADSNWPDTQEHFRKQFKGIPDDELERITWRNAADLFRLDIPSSVTSDPNAPWPTELANA
jgi:predicted TIM-barrel fold metal-dependent hydrolase